ncbi:MAG: prephenate dehydrogenase/arogenate dehydrogenase family protein [Candidatus Helarchaeota archaeon]
MKPQLRIAIVGGTGGMGQLFTKSLKPIAEILIISRSLEKAKQSAAKLGVHGGLLKDCATADITIVSVPIEATYQTCQKLLQILKPGSLLIDISAVKTFLKQIKDNIPESISYISMHPLFGPEGQFQGQNVILIPIQDNDWLPIIQTILINLGSQVCITSAQEHDQIMSKIQVAHHFIYLLLATYLSDTPISSNFFTRSFKNTLQNLQKILQNLAAILEIQKFNPYAKSTREELLSTVQELLSLENDTIKKKLLEKIELFKKNYFKKNKVT